MFTPSDETVVAGTVAIVYSAPGMGKSTLLAQAVKEAGDRGIWVSTVEEGLAPLQKDTEFIDLTKVNRVPEPITEWTDKEKGGMLEVLRWLCSPEQLEKYDVIAIDSLNLIKASLEEYCFKAYFINNPEHANKNADEVKGLAYQFGASNLISHMGNEWEKIVTALRYLKAKNKTVLVSCHQAIRKMNGLNAELDYDAITIDLPYAKKVDLTDMITKEAEFVVYGKKDLVLAQAKNKKTKVIGGDNRILVTQSNPTITAKFRGSAPEEIEFSWKALKEYI